MSRGLRIAFLFSLAAAALLAAPAANAQVIASDNFNRADESPFAIGGNWGRTIAGNYDGNSSLVGNQVSAVFKEGIYYWQGAGAGSFDPTRQFARQRVVQKNGEVGLVLLGGPDHSIMVAWGPPGVGDTVYIYWYKDGTDRGQLATGPSTINNGDIVEAVLENGTIYAKVNGVTVRSVANTTTLTAGVPGFITYLDPNIPTQVGILDDWEAGTPTSYSIGGTITEDGNPLSGVLVTASGGFSGSDTTGLNGTYSLAGVSSGTTSIVLTPTLSGHTMSPLTRTVTGPVLADVTGQDFTSTLNSGALLTIFANGGSVTRDPDQPSYTFGSQVTLTPVPDGGYTFTGWSGDVPVGQESANPLILTMNGDKTITAHFTSPGVVASDHFDRSNEIPLTVGGNWQKAVAGGSVNLIDNHAAGSAGIDAVYFWQGPGEFENARQFARVKVLSAGGQVGLVLLGGSGKGVVAAWGSGRLFIYWYNNGSHQGELANIAAPLQDGDDIEAVLDQGTIYAKRNGAVVWSVSKPSSLTTGKPGFETYQAGAVFDDWEAGVPPSYTISGTITENSAGLSGVTVTASGGFSGSDTTESDGTYSITGVPSGATSIVLTPTLFGHTMTPTTRTVPGPVTANVTGQDFDATPNGGAVLTINAIHGSVTRDPDLPVYPFASIVTLTPVADAGYHFVSWTGDVPPGDVTDNPLQLTMDQDRTVTALFIADDIIAFDHFNRANELPLVEGGNWQRTMAGGLSNLVNQHVRGASGEAVYAWHGPETFDPAAQFARVTVVQPNGQIGLVLKGATGQALVVAWNNNASGGTLYFYWYSGGSYQGNLATFPSTIQAGDVLEARLQTGIIYAKINGAVVASTPNTTTLSAGKPGFETFSTDGFFDNWEAGGALATYTISGTVTESSTGLAGVLVTASGGFSGSDTTGVDGTYTITGVLSGSTSVVLTPTLNGYSMSPTTRTVAGPVTADVTGQDFAATANGGAVLTTNATNGSVTRDPDLAVYPFGSLVTLTPVPAPGYVFGHWTGDVPAGDESDNPLQVTMNQDRTITAVFISTEVVALDNFNRANEFPLVEGPRWQRIMGGGLTNLVNQQARGANGEAVYFWNGPEAFDAATQFARMTVVQPNGQLGLVLKGAPGQAIVVAWNNNTNGGTLFFYWYLGSSYQGNLATVPSIIQAGDIIEARLEGGIIYAKINGVVVASTPNTTTLTGGKPGFETFLTEQFFDNWEAGPSPCTAEVCDNVDNDCDGTIDDGNPGGGGACSTGLPGVCSAGTLQCTGGGLVCQPNTGSTAEVCDGLDNDCDGTVDDGSLCDDGDACTVDSCQSGTCSTTPLGCDDGDVCTDDSCNPATGCVYANNTAACDDENACTAGDTCAAGVCVGGAPPNCDDANPCTDDTCNPVNGCEYAFNTGPCNDGNACTTVDSCSGGVCTGGTPLVCDDGNVCTDDSCNPATGCAYVDNTVSCDDGNTCTTADTCATGVCTGGAPLVCDDGNVCTDDSCNPATGCEYVNNTASCDDGNACTTGDTCSAGTCFGGAPPDCNDGNVCTDDTCNPATGCEYANNTAACDDGSACTAFDTCSAGVCVGGVGTVCNDDNACTDDVCIPLTGLCLFVPDDANTCSDGNVCTTGDTCSTGTCVGGAPLACNDGNVCTDDSCNPATGCVYVNNTASCDDGNACTTADTCAAGACAGGPALVCNDNNVCTDDSCNPATGCEYLNNTASCDDGNACTTADTCAAGACAGGPALDCNDGNVCTDDSCNPATGCEYANNTASCDDGTVCNGHEVCGGGTCQPGTPLIVDDGNVCTDDSCDPITGVQHTNNTASCDDVTVCNGHEVCGGGTCQPGTPLIVDDGNVCTDDSCDPVTGVAHTNNTVSCDDGNACTTADTCAAGACAGGPALACDDGNVCTTDSCNPATGCVTVNNTAACTDGNACTTGDVCSAGACVPGTPTVCNDTNACTDDACNPTTGLCGFVADDTNACTDGSACTTGDACVAGTCVGVPVPPPAEVQNVHIERVQPTKVVWNPIAGMLYDVASSTLSDLRQHGSATASCLRNDLTSATFNDNRPDPAVNDGYYYVIRAQGTCGTGTYGHQTGGLERTPAVCP